MNDENLKPVKELTPFTKMIMTIGTLPSSFYASMSYYESMVWLYEYLKNQVIPAVNNNGEAVIELQGKYIDLKEYVYGKVDELETFMNNYFDNLDVQQEINNKLDEMSQDGSLTALIKAYVDPIYEAYENEIDLRLDGQDDEISSFKSQVSTAIATMDGKIDNAISGSPKGVYATLSDLTTADPSHDYIYVVSDDGHWYYYNTSLESWEDGGTYQSTAIGSNTIGFDQLTTEVNSVFKLENPLYTLVEGKYIQPSGTLSTQALYNIATGITLSKGYTILVYSVAGSGVSAISKDVNSTYTNLVTGSNWSSNVFYKYTNTTDDDITIAVSYNNTYPIDIKTYLEEKTIYDYAKNNVTAINSKIDEIIDKKTPETTTINQKYVSYPGGYVYEQSAYDIEKGIHLKRNQTIVFKGVTTTGASAIASYKGSTYTALVEGTSYNTIDTYTYTATEDIDIACSYNASYSHNITTYDNIENAIDDINRILADKGNIFSMFSNITCCGDSLTWCEVHTGSESSDVRQAYRTWASILGAKTGATMDILARGGRSATTWWTEYGSDLTSKTNQLCIIYLGHNGGLTDTVATDCAGDDPDNFANTNTGNYGRIIAKCLSISARVLLVKCWDEISNASTTNKAIEDLATKFNVAWVKNPQLTDELYHLYPDGTGTNAHYNDLGYAVFLEQLIKNTSNLSDEMIELILPE